MKDRRTKVIATKVTEADKLAVEQLAEAEGRTVSDLLYDHVTELVKRVERLRQFYAGNNAA